ncbi:MAG TPA: hypothetical protein DD723_09410 [Candidatus Omnitrophica bacterium]|nr:MAG: hypothetical protein A2Y04_05095 [Omnitrophica WOR_2 bacterium GWC2_45_7]HBR15734.1 hypothetical protein [Candidatus Omnitrophota bacterium]
MKYILGVDFDNTIVTYDEVLHHKAVAWGMIGVDERKNKKNIRDKIRQLPDGETAWQRLQAYAYGQAMDEARLIEGVKMFFHACKNDGIRVSIISHKTEFAARDEYGINLREAAGTWMIRNGFFDKDGLGLRQENIYFEPTRQNKIARVKTLGCTHFIDDLEETFLEDSFPEAVEKILYDPYQQQSVVSPIKSFVSWKAIYDYFFERRG